MTAFKIKHFKIKDFKSRPMTVKGGKVAPETIQLVIHA